MNYEEFLYEKLNKIKEDLGIDIDIIIADEQAYAKLTSFTPKTVYVVIKYLSSDITFGARITPIQIVGISEQNDLESMQMLFNTFSQQYNYFSNIDNGTFIKHQYSTPVVLSNFTEVGYGYRSQLYFTGTLVVMENILDVKDLEIDNVNITPLSFNLSYQMSTNSQQRATDPLAKSVKQSATVSISLSIPLQNNNVATKILNITKGTVATYDGNNNFEIAFNIGNIDFEYDMKLTSAQIITAPNQIPALQIGMVR